MSDTQFIKKQNIDLLELQYYMVTDSVEFKKTLFDKLNYFFQKTDTINIEKYIIQLFLWNKDSLNTSLINMRTEIIPLIQKAILINDKYIFNYYLAEIFYLKRNKLMALEYANKSLKRFEIEYPNKPALLTKSLLEKIEIL